MAETLYTHIPMLSGVTTLYAYLRDKATGVLLNSGGNQLIETPPTSGRFNIDITAVRVAGAEYSARVHEGAESASTLVWDGWLLPGSVFISPEYTANSDGDATLEMQEAMMAELELIKANVAALGSSSTEAY